MPDTYEIKAPDGSTIEIQSDGPPSASDALRAIRAYGDSQAAAAQSKAEAQSTVGSVLKPIARGVLRTLPAAGAILGGAVSAGPTGGVGTVPGMALGAGAGRGLEDLITHATGLEEPSTPTQKAKNIGYETALTGATAAVLPGLVSAAKAPLQTLREGAEQFGSAMPQTVRNLGRLFAAPARAAEPILERPAWQTWPEYAADVPKPSHLDLSVPVRPSQLTQEQLGERIRFGTGTPPPPKGPVSVRPTPSQAPIEAPPEAPSVSPLRQPRVDIGAEKAGRSVGMSKEAMRLETGPVLGEAPGQASPILPEKALQKIIDTMKDLPKEGGAREAYVKAATSGKAQWQIENIRRTLEHLGLLVPIAAGASRLRMRGALTTGTDEGRQ